MTVAVLSTCARMTPNGGGRFAARMEMGSGAGGRGPGAEGQGPRGEGKAWARRVRYFGPRPSALGPPPSPAFTLIEVVISFFLMSTVFLGAMSAISIAAKDRRIQADIRTGQQLASSLMNEVLAQRYARPSGATAPTAGSTDRSHWTCLDDYAGLIDSPPRTRSNDLLNGATGWTRTVTLDYVVLNPLTFNLVTTTSSTATTSLGTIVYPLRRITVVATSPRGISTTLVGLRAARGEADQITPATGITTGILINTQVGADQRSLSAGVETLNRPIP